MGLPQIDPGPEAVHHIVDPEGDTAAAVGQAEAGLPGKTEELPGNEI